MPTKLAAIKTHQLVMVITELVTDCHGQSNTHAAKVSTTLEEAHYNVLGLIIMGLFLIQLLELYGNYWTILNWLLLMVLLVL